uniref:Uncharacterized protein n=1 Tax=Arundo donax TaxID=35708 RepID=A0A0A9HJE6_ARUDO
MKETKYFMLCSYLLPAEMLWMHILRIQTVSRTFHPLFLSKSMHI